MREGWRNEGSTTKKKTASGIDVPEFLAELGMEKYSTEMVKAVSDCAVIEFYYLVQVGEYTVKNKYMKEKNGAVQVGRYNVFPSGS